MPTRSATPESIDSDKWVIALALFLSTSIPSLVEEGPDSLRLDGDGRKDGKGDRPSIDRFKRLLVYDSE